MVIEWGKIPAWMLIARRRLTTPPKQVERVSTGHRIEPDPLGPYPGPPNQLGDQVSKCFNLNWGWGIGQQLPGGGLDLTGSWGSSAPIGPFEGPIRFEPAAQTLLPR